MGSGLTNVFHVPDTWMGSGLADVMHVTDGSGLADVVRVTDIWMGSGSADVLRVTGMTGNRDPRSSTRSGRLRRRESAPAAHSGPLSRKGILDGWSTLRKRPQ
jgi:hypothetical protein